jgi:hypothetical protein
MNGTEKWYAEILHKRQLAGEIVGYWFEGIKFKLGENVYYMPDFIVQLANMELEAHEVKGHWEDKARVKIKVAADKFPLRFIAIKKGKGGVMEIEEF